VCVCLRVCFLLLDLFQDDHKLRCLYGPHQVNHGGVQQPPPQGSLHKSHTTEELHPGARLLGIVVHEILKKKYNIIRECGLFL
jgi:hypothetical protein